MIIVIFVLQDIGTDLNSRKSSMTERELLMKILKYSRQRESIKTCLSARTDHPTADMIYTDIKEEFPNISLGTVYRNLNLLSELGEIQKLACTDGKDHFDWNTTPHYHFICKRCGAVLDLPMSPHEELECQAQKALGGVIDSHTVYFYCFCMSCTHNT